MALSYQRWTAEDDKLRNVLPDGEYPAYIDAIVQKLSAAGKIDKNGQPIPRKQMLEISLIVMTQDGRERKMRDWVMLEGDMSWKFRHLCAACDKLDDYDQDRLEIRELLKKIPTVVIKSRKEKDQSGMEVTRNTVADYVKATVSSNGDFIDDDIPPFA